jgi:hypothetical protein
MMDGSRRPVTNVEIAESPIELWTGRMREVTLSVAVVSLLAVIPYLSTLHGYFLSSFSCVATLARLRTETEVTETVRR